MKLLLLGGTGAMGTHLSELLNDGNNQIAVTTRSQHQNQGNLRYITGNAHDDGFLKTLLKEPWDAIVDFMVYTTAAFERRCGLLLNFDAHYIYISSARVYAESASPITENSPRLLDVSTDKDYLATDEYALSKARQEDLLFAAKRNSWSIIRPYITYSSERLQLGVLEKEDWLYRTLAGRTLVVSKEINARKTTLTHGLDVARGIQALLGKEAAMGQAFHITASGSICWSDVLNVYLKVLHQHHGGNVEVEYHNLNDFLQWRGAKYQIIYDRLYDRIFDNSKIDQFIHTSGFTTPEAGLTVCLQRFLEISPLRFKNIHWKSEAIKDRMLQERTPLSAIPGFKSKAKYFIFRHSSLT
ncbi:SDR family oxidoreductase [Hydrogenophaga sp.]|uniref:SDR family oxidoreductase n=1 Tax=Hydrogenophaga sp. TaxID=1904254 RepID=UPI003F6CF6FC